MYHFFLTLILLVGALSACSDSRTGIFTQFDGTSPEGQVIRLSTMDDTGEEVTILDTSTTSSEGLFLFNLDPNTNAGTIMATETNGVLLRGFYAGGSDSYRVHPYTEGLVQLISDITASEGGRTLSDFTASEIREIVDIVFSGDSPPELDDSDGILSFLKTTVGRQIALASGAQVSALPSDSLEQSQTITQASFDSDTNICGIGATFFLLEGDQFRFDVEEDGTLCANNHESLEKLFSEGALWLLLAEEVFETPLGGNYFPKVPTGTHNLEDAREISFDSLNLMGPIPEESGPREIDETISISRKVFVPQGKDYIRYLEIFENSGEEDRVLHVEMGAQLTTSSDSALLTFDTDNLEPSTEDRYVAPYDIYQTKPTAIFIYHDGNSTAPSKLNAPGITGSEPSQVTYTWETLSIPSGEKRVIAHYVLLTTSRDEEAVSELAQNFLDSPDMSGMSFSELRGLVNFTPNLGNIVGEPGAVIGQAEVTAINEVSDTTVTVSARKDGAFSVPLRASEGDTIQITASDGLNMNLTTTAP